MKHIWRLPEKILTAHQAASLRLTPICCETIEKYKNTFDWIIRQRHSTTLKNMQENIWESKKDFNITWWNICLLCWVTKIQNTNIWNNIRYKINTENDIIFLWNNKYTISIKWEKYWLPWVSNNPDINIDFEYDSKNWIVNYNTQKQKWSIIISKQNIINRNTFQSDKIVKTKIKFRAYNKDIELFLDFPLRNSSNNTNYKEEKQVA